MPRLSFLGWGGGKLGGYFSFSETLKGQNQHIKTRGETNQVLHQLPLAQLTGWARLAGGLEGPWWTPLPVSFAYSFSREPCDIRTAPTLQRVCYPARCPPDVLSFLHYPRNPGQRPRVTLDTSFPLALLPSSPFPHLHHLINHQVLSILPSTTS